MARAGTGRARTFEEISARQARRAGRRLALTYALFAALWILFSDQALGALHLPSTLQTLLSSTKGMLFVVVTASILYMFSVRYLGQLNAFQERYHRMFENATQGLVLFRVERDGQGRMSDLVIEDVNPAQLELWHAAHVDVVGKRSATRGDLPAEAETYYERAWEAVTTGSRARFEFHFEPTDCYYQVSIYPIEESLWAAGALDMTDARRAQKALVEQQESIRQAYVDVLDAVTGGKLVLLTDEELEESLGTPLMDARTLASPSELGDARRAISAAVETRFPDISRSPELLNPVGEALNNALKYAGSGKYRVYATNGTVQVAVTDDGPGIDFRTLPKATLVTGFSTVATLGAGFTIMLLLSERVLLSTRSGRTSVVLEVHGDVAQQRNDHAKAETRA